MAVRSDDARLSHFSDLVNGIGEVLATGRVSLDQRTRLIEVIDSVLGSVSGQSAELTDELTTLRAQIAETGGRRAERKPSAALTRQLKRVGVLFSARTAKWETPKRARLSVSFLALTAALAAPTAAYAAAPAIGDSVYNPITALNETVVDVINPVLVRTDKNNTILLVTTVGDTFTDTNTNLVYTVTAVTKNAAGFVTAITVKNGANTSTVNIVTDISGQIAANPVVPQPGGANGVGTTSFTFPTAAGDVNQYTDARHAKDGGDGSFGAGVKICLFGGCVTIGANASPGGGGATGDTITANVTPANNGNITTVSNDLPGIIVVSGGGNGGKGGNGVGNVPGGAGGAAGAGGSVTVNSSVSITTTGTNSDGILARSNSGKGGTGGTGYLFSSGGSGGSTGQGGTVLVNNSGQISTSGDGAIGIAGQSLGGDAGTSGSSYGIVGSPGDGSVGGNGGSVTINNSGVIHTQGVGAYGIQAQSVGGSGGNVGNSGGIVAFGGTGGNGGSGGSATINALTGSSVSTTGSKAYGLFAQSIGGGGGAAGGSGGLVAFGSDGSTAGNGGAASVTLAAGASVDTTGREAHGVFVESVGGGGGAGGGAGGAVAVGGKGGSGGTGGTASANIAGSISTTGIDARGLFVQSIGGGGGSVEGVGGLVAIGGSGTAGGKGGDASATIADTASITTTNSGATGVYVQSVGGGGGSGSASGGVVALGGTGGNGGAGGNIAVTNAGSITTGGSSSRGIFAQSVGGGGGDGGDGGGLVIIGGGGSAASTGGNVSVSNSGTITTGGNKSTALYAQSIGGGGGNGGTTGGVFLSIGGQSGGGGDAGIVTVDLSGSLSTSGNDSHGIFAQAVGGGGGDGGSASSLSAFVGVAIGGGASDGGNGGRVEVNMTPRTVLVGGTPQVFDPLITTGGDRSRGIQAQSVGGGGGNGGFAVQVTGGVFGGASIALGGTGGGGGLGGHVTLDGKAHILTTGKYSEGILAQSVGGGGGSGGFSVAVAAAGGPVGAALSIGVGGSGGAGGNGGLVEVNSGGSIVTTGRYSTGFLAQSVGGGGGAGGFDVSVAAAGGGVAASLAIGIGGSGANGGDGGVVNANFDGTISTSEADAGGALIQSVGGAGGRGGFNVSGALSFSSSVSVGIAVGLGGSGGGGGDGNTVTGSIGDNVQTLGARSTGVLIQSAGGGGGSGGFNISGSITGSGTFAGGASFGLGGSGAGGGIGGTVTGDAHGTIYTRGNQSDGLVVQSTGGGGGNGGFNVSGSFGAGGTFGGGLSIGLGGAGGTGGIGGSVTGTAWSAIHTIGNQSRGAVFQSNGGGGGNGGFNVSGSLGASGSFAAGVSFGMGGSGGTGGAGGTVDAKAVSILTEGNQSAGFLAQSTGGGGGAGGFNVSGSMSFSGKAGIGLSIGLGGSGGGGGSAARVNATVVGDVTTLGTESTAITAQSVGGGGGSGGFDVAGGIAASGTVAGAISVGLGGAGGSGGSAGPVTLDVTGTTRTQQDKSDGIFAQSAGGGGGAGGFNVSGGIALAKDGAGTIGVGVGGSGGDGGSAEAVTLRVNQGVADAGNTLLAVATRGDKSRGIIAQSVGGGGGLGGFNVTGGIAGAKTGAGNIGVGVGGGGGGGGTSAKVDAAINGDVGTIGNGAGAVLVQSVGGGGGSGGFNVTGGIALSKDFAGNALVGVGGYGGDGGGAGEAVATLTSDIGTLGDDSYGLTVQSLGGGGGSGGFNVTGGISLSTGAGIGAGTIGVGVGGFGGGGGNAMSATATMTGSVYTGGLRSHGILVQSVGGGGGDGAFNVTGVISLSSGKAGTLGIGLGGFGGTSGNGAAVTGTLTGNVTTIKDQSFGAMLQSAGGSGGNGAFNVTGSLSISASNNASIAGAVGIGGFGGTGGDSGKVTGIVTGTYRTSGDHSDGVIAQSLAGGGGNGGINVSGAIALSTGTAGTASIGIGGFGGGGGDSGEVILTRLGDTFTSGTNSDGITAQSIAGGGGKGGIDIAGGISGSTSGSTASFGFGLGGFGGAGGTASKVTATVTGNVIALGGGRFVVQPGQQVSTKEGVVTLPSTRVIANGSNGVLVQSVGGSGGAGGLNVTGQIALTAPGATSKSRVVSLGIGGFGGTGGDAGDVELTIGAPGASRVQVSGYGDEKAAVIAQSLGGGGGVGGINISGGIAMDGQLTVGIGGFGGDGGLGRNATATVDADLFATGTRSRGLLVQSVGGGGGVGGINISGGVSASTSGTEPSVVFGIGGFGGAGNRSGDATATQNGQILVDGVKTIGVLVQSVAGGGGDGGMNVSAAFTLGAGTSKLKGVAVAAGLGGFGGTGADAGAATLTSNGNILVNTKAVTNPATGAVTLQATDYLGGATGILVQSIGGGGGVGGMDFTGAIAPFGNPIALGIGGTGGAGGDAGKVVVTRGYTMVGGVETETPSLIRTFGDDSKGLVAQSVGGGGGMAGINGVLTVTAAAPSENPVSATIAVGGSGGDAGNGGDVTVRHRGDIQTSGANSAAIQAQSISKGGGSGTFNIGGGLARKANSLNAQIGGTGGDGGSAGAVTVAHNGTIITGGRGSFGIIAQSIGGGGGAASTDFGLVPLAKNEISMTLGQSGGSGGTGGAVTIDAAGLIKTTGNDSSAIIAQSIGGGGGQSGSFSLGASFEKGTGSDAETYSAALSIGLDGGASATGGAVIVRNAATISTHGTTSRGIWAQSIGGSGGIGGSATGVAFNAAGAATVAVGGKGGAGSKSSTVDVTNSAVISTDDTDSDGILAQSIGGGGGNGGFAASAALQLGASPGTVRTFGLAIGGSGGTAGVGDAVHVTNTGTILTAGARSYGIRAQSIGGGGGIGGATIDFRALAKSGSDSFNINVGGAGGTGEAAGSVDVVNEGLIWTKGADASGISANSIGGGGGDAGLVMQLTAGVTGGDKQTHNVTINIGGTGGNGGAGGAVTVINRKTAAANSGIILTEGKSAYGIFAQSLGGGGGNSSTILSFNGLVAGKDSFTAGLNFGSVGGTGNTGGTVTVTNSGGIETKGDAAYGIFAQSIGGGGGNGGLALAGSVLVGSATSTPLLSIGGIGGSGGDGGTVTVNNSGTIVTHGVRADGIVAQSIGGGGGNAGVGLGLSPNEGLLLSNAISTVVGLAGGGSGGTGGNVIVNHSGDITVLGKGSQAIKAESINGGGGSLAFDVSGITGLPGVPVVGPTGNTKRADPLIAARAGAENATGMNAGKVTLNLTGTFGVAGKNGLGVFTQSIGGGGGSIDMDLGIVALHDPTVTDPQVAIGVAIALGGLGGSGNNGGTIDGTHSGGITTNGDGGAGVLLQSIGGGGGRAVLDVTAEQMPFFAGGTVTLGGTNVNSSVGGTIARIQSGAVITTGAFAPGVIVQSIGGGGGAFIVSTTTGIKSAVVSSQAPDPQTAQSLIQTPLADPTVVADAPAPAAGVQLAAGDAVSAAQPAQASIGDIVDSGPVSASPDAAISSAQNVAAGGATLSSDPAQVAIGDLATPAPQTASVVTATPVSDPASVAFVEASAPAAQPATVAFDDSATPATTSLTANDAFVALASPQVVPPPTPITLVFGANGGAGLNGGNIGLGYSGGFTTLGDYSPALIVQSIGAGGGLSQLNGSFIPTITLGGSGGASGNGGNITVTNSGTIRTEGSHSHGVFLQSIGGGGGAAFGAFTSPTLTLSNANSGNGGAIAFTQTGDIVVLGSNAYGVVAQSLGGGGGWVEGSFAGTAGGNGAGGAITLNLSGATFASGINSTAILAQSLGANGGGNIALTSNGLIRGGSGAGAGVRFAGGANNSILSSGSISSISGLAIEATTGNDNVRNTGLIVGNVNLGSGNNALLNDVGGTFVAFNLLKMRDGAGSTGTFTNSGDFLMGLSAPRFPIDLAAGATFGNVDATGTPATNLLYGARVINTVALDGNFVQTSSGFMAFDVAFGPYASDRVNVTGNTTVAGRGEVILTWLENKNPVTLFATAGTATNNGLNIKDTLALDYSVLANTVGIQLTFTSNFGQPFLNRNGRALGGHMDSAVTQGGSGGIGRLLALLGNMQTGEEAAYKAVMDQLNPEPFLVAQVNQFNAAREFSGQLFGCENVNATAGEGCVWAQAGAQFYKRTGDFEHAQVGGEMNGRFRTGFERPLGGDWMLGGALGYDSQGTMHIDGGRAFVDGDGVHAGLGARYAPASGAQFAASLSGGMQWNHNQRAMNIFGPAIGLSDQSTSYGQVSAEAAYVFGTKVFARPSVRGSYTALRQNGFSETGLAGLGVEGLRHTQWIGTVNPDLTLGVQLSGKPGAGVVFSVTGGGVFQSTDRLVAPFRLLGANPAATPAMIGTGIDKSSWHAGAQLRVVGTDKFSLRLNYDRETGARSTNQSYGLDARIRF